jgi:hypothetical protein
MPSKCVPPKVKALQFGSRMAARSVIFGYLLNSYYTQRPSFKRVVNLAIRVSFLTNQSLNFMATY